MDDASSQDPARTDLFRVIADYTYDWETWVDAQGVTRWINPAVRRITGHSVADCMAMADYPLCLAHPADRTLLQQVLDDAAHGGSGNDAEFRVLHKSGHSRWVAVSWQPVRSERGEGMGYRTSVRDIDERKRMEQELHMMRRRAEASAIARTQLLANTSHELRTPVHCIAGFAELLAASPLDATQRRYVQLISDQCHDMLRQVEDLLQLTALEAGGVRIERAPLDLEALVRGVVEAAAPVARARGLTLDCELELAPRKVEGDATRLKQVLRNLVDNALKFTERGGVRVRVQTLGEVHSDAGVVELSVRDTGIGIDPHLVARMLEPFQQADASPRKRRGGVGLGLSICERLVRAMEGTLHLESTPGQGTLARVMLPLPPSSSERESNAQALSAPPHVHGGRALIVDDNPTARELLHAMLALWNWDAHEVDSGQAALEAVSSQTFDLVLLDYQMPEGDGAETAMALRRALGSRHPERHVPIYLLTANVFVHEQLGTGLTAVDGILGKPLARAALGTLLRAVEQHRLQPKPPPGGADEQRAHEGEEDDGVLDLEVIRDLKTMHARDGRTLLALVGSDTLRALPRELSALQARWREGDAAACEKHAHALAGHAALVGARTVADLARKLELMAGSAEHGTEAPGELAALRKATRLAEGALRKLLE